MKLLTPNLYTRAVIFFIGDFIISLFTFITAYMLRFNFDLPNWIFNNFYLVFFILFFFKFVYLVIFKQYVVSWRFYSIYDLKRLIIAITLAYFTFFIFYYIFKNEIGIVPRSAILIDYFLSILFIGFFRITRRAFSKEKKDKENVILVGANENTNHLMKKFNIVDIYDDEGVGSHIQGHKIKPIKDIVKNVSNVIITKELERNELDKLVDFLQKKGFEEIKIYNPFEKRVKDISIEDLLARKPKDLDKEAIKNFVKNKKILITGAGGSIGSEICRLCEKYGARELVLVDNCEFNLYAINEELKLKREPYLVDVSKKEELKRVFEKEKPEIVIHAAAYKHVPMCEYNPRSAVINNILGTKNTIDLAIEFNVKDFILISTDKAVRPTNIMGATKRVCEIYAQNVVLDSKNTKISAVRFGNVLGSSGSVVPKFKKLLEENKSLTVTHPEITRYFMLIPEACELVLQAGSLGENGEIFILDMGEPVKIVDLARKMLRLYGKDENNIKFTGLRPGEKLYEELLINEADKKTKYKDIFIAKPTKYDFNYLQRELNKLFSAIQKEEIIKILKNIVPEFNHKN